MSRTRIAVSVLVSILVISLFNNCSKESKNPAGAEDDVPAGDFKLGQSTELTVSLAPNQTLSDSTSGLTFLFPEGASGILKTAPIVSTVSAPVSGEGYYIDYNASDRISLVFQPEDSETILVYGYGTSLGLLNDYTDRDHTWVGFPARSLSDGSVAFDLVMPFEVAGKPGVRTPTGHQGFSHVWVSKIKAGTSDDVKLKAYRMEAATMIGQYLAELPSSMEASAKSEILGSMAWNLSFGSDAYDAFLAYTPLVTYNSYSISIGREYSDPGEISGHIAHETGHYLYHVVGGNSNYMTVYSQMPWDTGNHGVGDVNDRKTMFIEEPAYFADYLQNGTVGQTAKPTEPKSFLYTEKKVPWTVDAPSIEGFGCAMLASLHRSDEKIMDVYVKGAERKVPVAGLKFLDILSLMYQTPVPTNIDMLRERILAYLTLAGKGAIFQPIMHGIGWSYSVKGTLKDSSGNPVADAAVKSIYNDGTQQWEGGATETKSASDGSFSIPRGVFAGKSALRIYSGSDSVDVTIEIDWAKPTNTTVNLGSVTVEAPYGTVTQTKTTGPYLLKFGAGSSAETVAEIMMTTSFTASGIGIKEVNGTIVAPLNSRIHAYMTATFSTNVITSVYGVNGTYQVGEPRLYPPMKMALRTDGAAQVTDLRSETAFAFEAVFTTSSDGVSSAPYFVVPLKVTYYEDGTEYVRSDSEHSFAGGGGFRISAQ